MKVVNLVVNVILLLQTALSVSTGHQVSLDDDDLLKNSNASIKSIQSEDGDIIDCIDIYRQPAFSHPALKDHKIQMKPSYVPTLDITSGMIKKNKQKADIPNSVTAQLWHKSGSCPEGTVPIRRIRKKSEFESKKSTGFLHYRKHGFKQSKETESLLHLNHSMSIMLTEGFAYIGAKGDIAIFNPSVELDNEYTLSHISLENGERDNFEAVRSGWAVNPGVYGDRQTRFFSYWTVDGSQKTGCFDHTCPGFVQVRNDIALGAAMHPNSTPSGLPSAVMTIYIFKDLETDNWWVNYGENRNIGYWPGELFSLLKHHATSVQWGGDVYSSKVGIHPHTATGMGSGDYAFPDGQTSVFINTSEQSKGVPTNHISKTIQSEYGDVIDCIPIDKQPAFSHPALKNHTIQMRPSSFDQIKGETTEREGSIPISLTMWQSNGRCPQGSIPIRRSKTGKAHRSKKPNISHDLNKRTTMGEDDMYLLQLNHSLAVLIAAGFAYHGAKGDIKVCYPHVEHDDDYSASEVTLVTGPYRNYEAIKSGWIVNPGVYGDRQTRLFVYWTVDGSVNTGCFDHTCPGFVQINSDILLGSPISSPISSNSNGVSLTPVITIFIQKDPVTSNWWVHYNEEVSIGYWPAELFSGLRYHAESVQWGGEVYSSRAGVHPGHTGTHMACGQFANPWPHSNSGFVKRMRVQQNAELVSPVLVNTYADEYRCYNTMYLSDYVEDPELYYGGPGRNPTCP